MNSYHEGDLVRVTYTFTDANGDVHDPVTITHKHKDPGGTVTTWTYAGGTGDVKKQDTGIYYADVDVDAEGVWFYRGEGTGATQQAAVEGQFVALESEFS